MEAARDADAGVAKAAIEDVGAVGRAVHPGAEDLDRRAEAPARAAADVLAHEVEAGAGQVSGAADPSEEACCRGTRCERSGGGGPCRWSVRRRRCCKARLSRRGGRPERSRTRLTRQSIVEERSGDRPPRARRARVRASSIGSGIGRASAEPKLARGGGSRRPSANAATDDREEPKPRSMCVLHIEGERGGTLRMVVGLTNGLRFECACGRSWALHFVRDNVRTR